MTLFSRRMASKPPHAAIDLRPYPLFLYAVFFMLSVNLKIHKEWCFPAAKLYSWFKKLAKPSTIRLFKAKLVKKCWYSKHVKFGQSHTSSLYSILVSAILKVEEYGLISLIPLSQAALIENRSCFPFTLRPPLQLLWDSQFSRWQLDPEEQVLLAGVQVESPLYQLDLW